MFKTGDIVLTSEGGLTAWFMRLFQRDPVRFGHVAIIETNESIIESKGSVRRVDLHTWFGRHPTYKVVRYEGMTALEANKILDKIGEIVGEAYGTKRYLLQFLDHITFSNYFTKKFMNEKNQICSSLIAWGFYEVINFFFNDTHWPSCDPDDIDDEAQRNEAFVVVKEKN